LLGIAGFLHGGGIGAVIWSAIIGLLVAMGLLLLIGARGQRAGHREPPPSQQ